MSKISSGIVKLNKQKSIPAIVIDVVGRTCTIVLSGRGKTLHNVPYIGPSPTVGDSVDVNYSSGRPVVEAGAQAIVSHEVASSLPSPTPTAGEKRSSYHNDQKGLQGGTPAGLSNSAEYYHLTQAEKEALGGSGGHIIADEGTPLAAKPTLDFAGDGVSVENVGDSTVVTIPGGAGHEILDGAGDPMDSEPALQFTGKSRVSDDAGVKTIVDIPAPYVGDEPPANPEDGDLWWDTDDEDGQGGPYVSEAPVDESQYARIDGAWEKIWDKWEDLRIEPNVRQAAGAGVPSFEKYFDDSPGTSKGVYLLSFTDEAVAGNEKEVFFTMQMPHAWNGTPISVHVHFVPAATVNASDIIFGLEYIWKDIGEVFGDTTIIYSSTTLQPDDANITAGKHYIAEFADITPGASADGISSILIGRLFRNSSNANDTYTNKVGLLYIDAHYQADASGSTEEYVK